MKKIGTKRLLLLAFCVFLALARASGQSSEYPFKSGEWGTYGAYYNWHFIWVQGGEVEFKANVIKQQGKDVWHLQAIGRTFKAYDLLYAVRDTFEAYHEYDTYKPITSRRVVNHGKQHSECRYLFDAASGKTDVLLRRDKEPEYRSSFPSSENIYDLLPTAYHFRKFDFDKLVVGQKVTYQMLIDRQVANLFFRYLGKENVKTRNGKEYRCHKVSVYLLQGDFFPEGEYMKIWFTDDKNRIPVQVDTKILIGSVKAVLLDAGSIKYPITSQIK